MLSITNKAIDCLNRYILAYYAVIRRYQEETSDPQPFLQPFEFENVLRHPPTVKLVIYISLFPHHPRGKAHGVFFLTWFPQ
jgi:hypothetical protein